MGGNGTTSTAAEQHQRITEALQRIVEPLREEIVGIDRRLEDLNTERAELLSAKGEAMKVLRAADPVERAKYRKPRPKGASNGSGVSPETLEQLAAFLHRASGDFPEGFNTRALDDHRGLTMNKTTIGRALPALAEDGIVRLDRIGYLGEHKTGRESRIYKLVETHGRA